MRQGIFDAIIGISFGGSIAGMIIGVLLAIGGYILIGAITIFISWFAFVNAIVYRNHQVSGPTFSKKQIRKMNKEMGKLKEKDNEDGRIEGEKSYNRYG